MYSPPIPRRRASDPVITPWDVDMMATPMPPYMRGIFLLPTYTRKPGLLTRFRPEMADCFLSQYLRRTRSVRWGPLRRISKSSMNPSSFIIRARATFGFEPGTRTESWCTATAFLILVSMSAIGSVRFIGCYQLAFLMPVISPLSARVRKQILHSPKCLM